jgi:hypothetical protein
LINVTYTGWGRYAAPGDYALSNPQLHAVDRIKGEQQEASITVAAKLESRLP